MIPATAHGQISEGLNSSFAFTIKKKRILTKFSWTSLPLRLALRKAKKFEEFKTWRHQFRNK
jgi:hypothetical protein